MFKKIGYLLLSMFVVFKHLFKRPVTLEYPEKKITPPENFRGKPVVENCKGCGVCLRVCPSGAIKIARENHCFKIDLKKCIFCGNCTFYCPHGAIKMSKEYELALRDREKLILNYPIGGADERN